MMGVKGLPINHLQEQQHKRKMKGKRKTLSE
jgi:hypothetical protein